MYLTDLADVLRAAGLSVVEIPGWKTRGRPGTFEPIGVLCHHTGGTSDSLAYAEWMALEGRSDLNPPLAQLALNRRGTFIVMAAGRANHAGACKPIAGLQTYSGRDYGDGNAQLVGIEAMNTGSEGWTTAQYRAYVRGCAALNAAYGFPVKRTLAHRETSLAGKPDPGGIDMTKFRSDVAAEDLSEGDSMSAADVAELKDYLGKVLVAGYTVGDKSYPGIAAVDIENQRRIGYVRTDLAVLAAVVEKIAADTIDPEELAAIRAEARAGAAEGVKDMVDATVTADVDIVVTPKEPA